jgi:hypothetical protein
MQGKDRYLQRAVPSYIPSPDASRSDHSWVAAASINPRCLAEVPSAWLIRGQNITRTRALPHAILPAEAEEAYLENKQRLMQSYPASDVSYVQIECSM